MPIATASPTDPSTGSFLYVYHPLWGKWQQVKIVGETRTSWLLEGEGRWDRPKVAKSTLRERSDTHFARQFRTQPDGEVRWLYRGPYPA